MPSPLCTINGGTAGQPGDVTASSTVTIALANTSGANLWSLTVVSTDELNTVAAVAATLSVNQTTKTATFTAPSSLGSAVILQSQVGVGQLGYDGNFVPQPSFTTTLKVNVTVSGQRVLAANEGTEQSATFGWVAIVNPALRSLAAGSVAMAGDVVGTNSATIVKQITGVSNVVTILCPSVTIGSSVTSPSWTQAATSGATGTNWTIQAQNSTATTGTGGNLVLSPGTGTSTNQTPGNVVVSIPAAAGSGTAGQFQVNDAAHISFLADNQGVVCGRTDASQFGCRIAPLIGQESTWTAFWVGSHATAPAGANYDFLINQSQIFISSGGTGSAIFAGFLTVTGSNTCSIAAAAAAAGGFTISQLAASGAAATLSITAQGGGGTNDGGPLVLSGGAHAGSSTVDASVKITTPLNAGALTFSPAAGANTLTNAQSDANVVLFGTQASAFTINYLRRIADTSLIFVRNPSGNGTATIAYLTGGTVTVAAATSALIVSDGANLQKIIVGT